MRSSRFSVLLFAASLTLLATACGQARPTASPDNPPSPDTCAVCHGTPGRTGSLAGTDAMLPAAPPVPPPGFSTDVNGAHQFHLNPPASTVAMRGPLACNECHVVPTSAAHAANPPANPVVFGTLATAHGASPSYQPPSKGCAATYCHGNFSYGTVVGANATPVWGTIWTTTEARCSYCHGMPPQGHLSTGSSAASCSSCHPGTVNADGTINVTGGKHVNGQADVSALGCAVCHGTAGRTAIQAGTDANLASAPPVAPAGAPAYTVGAHLSHMNPPATGSFRGPLPCSECHVVPTDAAHATNPPAVKVVFGALATTQGASPVWTVAGTTCASTYCHGNFAYGAIRGASATPDWTTTGLGCTSCHGLPPTGHAPTDGTAAGCSSCHPGSINPDGSVNLVAGKHLNGQADVSPLSCTSCHGTFGRQGFQAGTDGDLAASPPVAPAGAPTYAVGAHQSHLNPPVSGSMRGPLACNECHVVPANFDHAVSPPAQRVVFGTLATTQGASPTWTAGTTTCAATYCHGNFAYGAVTGGHTSPLWTDVGIGCTSCHGLPPQGHAALAPPVTAASCNPCHPGAINPNGSVNLVDGKHLNGQADVVSSCTSCHGTAGRVGILAGTDANLPASPPAAPAGAPLYAVGAHQSHLNPPAAGYFRGPLPCNECHVVPTSAAHATNPPAVKVVFGTLASTQGVTPTWTAGTTTCASTYCHGNFAYNGISGTNASPLWVGGALACTSCHAMPPAGHTPTDGTAAGCSACHPGSINPDGSVNLVGGKHLNGQADVAPLSCTSCHGTAGRVGIQSGTDVNLAASPPVAPAGAPAYAVGAHQSHLNPPLTGSYRAPLACGECHLVPINSGHATNPPVQKVVFGVLATTQGVTPVWTAASTSCAATYCHGNFAYGTVIGGNATPLWTGAALGCTACHGLPPTGHPTLSPPITAATCSTCHPDTVNTDGTINLAGGAHINGQADVAGEPVNGGSSCGGCHASLLAQMTSQTPPASRHTLGSDSPIDGAFSWTGATLDTSVTLANRSCVTMCHGDHPHTLTSPVASTHDNNAYFDATTQASRANGSATRIGAGGSGTQNRAKTDFDPVGNAGLCSSCHQRPILVATGITVTAATFGASAHDFTANGVGTPATTYTWTYAMHDGSLFARNCTKCHASRQEGNTPASATVQAVHYSTTDPNLLAGSTNPAGVAAGFACYNCHGSTASPAVGAQGNRSGKDIQSQILHATTTGQSGHPADSDSVHNSVAEQTNAVWGNQLGVAAGAGQRHSSCMDCHDPHEAKPTATSTRVTGSATNGNVAGPALQGAWGAKLTPNPAAWTAPTAANFTKTVMVAGTDVEATLCFKCHSSYYWGAGTPPNSPSLGSAQTDTAKEFNPANVGYHPVLAAATGKIGMTTNLNAPWTSGSLMTCTDCHESDVTTDPNGPHGSAAKFILKGPNTNWSNTIVGTSAGIPAGTFCLNCHPATATNSRFTVHWSRSQHRVACFNCHAAIPHGGPRPGILVAPAGAAAGIATTGWDTTLPYSQPGSGTRLGIASYPTSNTAAWQQSNCGCGSATPH